MLVKVKCDYCGNEISVKNHIAIRNEHNFCNSEHYGKWRSLNQIGENNPVYKPKVKRVCKGCGVHYEVIPSLVRNDSGFHSFECYQEWRKKESVKNKVNVKCLVCGTVKPIIKSRYLKGIDKTCSKECEAILKSRTRQGENNPMFGKTQTLQSRENISKNRRGKCVGNKAPGWRGGVMTLYAQIRDHYKMTDWKKAVYKKDNYRDYYSGCTQTPNNHIEAHHIIPQWKIIKKYNIKTIEDAINCDALWDVNNGRTLLHHSHRAYHNLYGYDYE